MTPSSPANLLTEAQAAKLNWRVEILRAYDQIIAEDAGTSMVCAAERLGVSATTLTRMVDARTENPSIEALIPKVGPGRKSALDKLRDECGAAVVDSYLEKVRGHVLASKTTSGTLRFLAKTDRAMPEPMRAVILDPSKASKHNIPPSIVSKAKVTRVQILAHQGKKALRLHGSYIPISIDDVLPGDGLVIDDTTPIWGMCAKVPKSKEYPFGWKAVQAQLLEATDYASGKRTVYGIVIRDGSSYRTIDEWTLLGDAFDHGLPRLFIQLEGGISQGSDIRGKEVIIRRPGEPAQSLRVGALNLLPTNPLPYHVELAARNGKTIAPTLYAVRSLVPRSKPVESAFRLEQPLQSMLLYGALGTDQRRNAIEQTCKVFRACQRGAADPSLHFLTYSEVMKRLKPIYEYLDNDRMEGPKRSGTPQEMWDEWTSGDRALLQVPSQYQWLYRNKWLERTIKGAFLDCSYRDADTDNYVRLHYHNPEEFAQRDGQRVLIYFNSKNPELPAQVVSLDGKWLCSAEYWTGTGAISFLGGNPLGFEIQERYEKTVIRETRVLQKHTPSLQVPPEVQARRDAAAAEKREAAQTPLSAVGARGQGNPFIKFSGGEGAPVAQSQRQTGVRAMSYEEIVDAELPPPERVSPLGGNRTGQVEPGLIAQKPQEQK